MDQSTLSFAKLQPLRYVCGMIASIPISTICGALCQQHGWRGAVLVADNTDETIVGQHGLTFDEQERALCLALYFNTHAGLEAKSAEENP
jgi:hypothetical protein